MRSICERTGRDLRDAREHSGGLCRCGSAASHAKSFASGDDANLPQRSGLAREDLRTRTAAATIPVANPMTWYETFPQVVGLRLRLARDELRSGL